MDPLNIPIQVEGFDKGVAVNIGNPHVVFFGKSIENINLSQIGPKIEKHYFFPNKTNVEFIEILNSNTIKMKVWREERVQHLHVEVVLVQPFMQGGKKN